MRILLAEDEKALSRAIVRILEKNNYSADPVYDGEEALAYLESGYYDAAVLDIMMPKMDGLTVLKRIRAAGETCPGCLIGFTAPTPRGTLRPADTASVFPLQRRSRKHTTAAFPPRQRPARISASP